MGTWVNVLKSHLHLVIPVSLYKSMSWFVTKTRTHTHTHTHTLSLSHTHTLSLSHTHSLSLSLSLSLTHTHTHTLSLSLSLSHTHTHSTVAWVCCASRNSRGSQRAAGLQSGDVVRRSHFNTQRQSVRNNSCWGHFWNTGRWSWDHHTDRDTL